MYAIIPQQIPQGMRAEVNEKILFAIDSGKDLIPAESIYNCYTGIGGLHNLRQSDFANYNEYAEAKKEFEMGQFFTPHEICRDMVDMLCPVSSEMVLDMCCGMGNFFNHLPNPHNAYGFDIDGKAVSVARYLYPEAHIEKCDIRQYYPEQRFDVIIGNPPFNGLWQGRKWRKAFKTLFEEYPELVRSSYEHELRGQPWKAYCAICKKYEELAQSKCNEIVARFRQLTGIV